MKIRLNSRQRVEFNLSDVQLPEIPLLGIDRQMFAEPGISMHIHEGLMEIHFVKQGEQVFHVAGRDYTVRSGEFFVTWPDEPHSFGGQPHSRCVIYWTHFRLPRRHAAIFDLTAAKAQPLLQALRTLPRRHISASPAIASLFEEMFHIQQNSTSPTKSLELSSRYVQWLIEVVRCAQRQPREKRTADIASIVRRIEGDPLDCPTLQELAADACLSLSRFKAKFKQQVGLPPREFLLRCKINLAKRWLRESAKPITTMAFQLGFSSSQNFATIFKRYVSLSPRDFRAGKQPEVTAEYPVQK